MNKNLIKKSNKKKYKKINNINKIPLECVKVIGDAKRCDCSKIEIKNTKNSITKLPYIIQKDKVPINPFTDKTYKYDNYDNLLRHSLCQFGEQRGMPAASFKSILYEKLNNCNVLLIEGLTGCGKTMMFPMYALEYYITQKNMSIEEAKVICTVPKRAYATNSYPAMLMGVELGEEYGWSVKGNKNVSNRTQLSIVTEGTLVQEVINDPYLEKYSCIIIDEVHERNVDTDMLIYFVSNLLKSKKRPDVKLILMSAKADFPSFQKYFEKSGLKVENMFVGTETKPTIPNASHTPNNPKYFNEWDPFFLQLKEGEKFSNSTDKIFPHILKIIDRILKNDPTLPHQDFFEKYKDEIDKQDILVFMSSKAELIKGCQLLKEKYGDDVVIEPNEKTKHNASIGCFVYHAKLKNEQQNIATEMNHDKLGIKRKIIFTTNATEASITIESLAFVIDVGMANNSGYDPVNDEKTLMKEYVTTSQIKQRMGRVGRKQPGAIYFIYPKEEYLKMKDYKQPAIYTEGLDIRSLQLLSISTIQNFSNLISLTRELLSVPGDNTLYNSLKKLRYLGCIDNDGSITTLGSAMALFATSELHMSRSLIYSHAMKVEKSIIPLFYILSESDANNVADLLSINELSLLKEENRKKYITSNDFTTLVKIFYIFYVERHRLYLENKEKLEMIDEEIRLYRNNLKNSDDRINTEKLYNDFIEKKDFIINKIRKHMLAYCYKNQLNYEKLENIYKVLNEGSNKNPLDSDIFEIFGNDVVYMKMIENIKKDNTVKLKIPYYKKHWNSLPIEFPVKSEGKKVYEEKYQMNLLKCLLIGGYMNIAVLDKKTYKYHKIGTNIVLQIGQKDKAHLKNVIYNLPDDKKLYPKFIYYHSLMSGSMGRNVSFIWGFNNPFLFYIPGLFYYLKAENTFTHHKKLLKDIRNLVSSVSHMLKIKETGYYYYDLQNTKKIKKIKDVKI